jgi:acetate---CoA ligase (ADP-forming)
VGEAGLQLAEFSEETLKSLGETLPDYAAITNPVDATSDILARPEIGKDSLLASAEDPEVGVVIYPFPCDYAELTGSIGEAIVEVQAKTDTPIVAAWMSDRLGEGYDALVAGGLVPSRSVKRTTKAVRRWVDRGAWAGDTAWRPLGPTTPAETLRTLAETDAKDLLRGHGVPVPTSQVVRSADDAVRAAARIGYPLVAKIVSEEITHKSDLGAVKVGLQDEEEVRAAYGQIVKAVVAAGHQETRVMVEVMAPAGLDVLIGVTKDPVFGPLITFGLGGVYVELFNDVARRLLPLNRSQAQELINEPKCSALLKGLRGAQASDIDALADLLVAVSDFVETNAEGIEELELNPVRVLPAGEGVLALDAVLVVNEKIGESL